MSQVKEHPILFSAPMVRAILEGRNTVTRRVCKPQPSVNANTTCASGNPMQAWWETGKDIIRCPYGKPGARLWVRETFSIESNRWADDPYSPPHKDGRPTQRYEDDKWDQPHYKATDVEPELWYDDRDSPGCRWKPSIHMPRWACRILLEITDVRVEGVRLYTDHAELGDWWHVEGIETYSADPRKSFELLWSSVGGDWQANPWCWVVEFKRVTP